MKKIVANIEKCYQLDKVENSKVYETILCGFFFLYDHLEDN